MVTGTLDVLNLGSKALAKASLYHKFGTLSAEGLPLCVKTMSSVWLDAWHDPVAGLKTHSACVRLVDLHGDGDSKLLIADTERKLAVYKGVTHPSYHTRSHNTQGRRLIELLPRDGDDFRPCIARRPGGNCLLLSR
jgi:hypothetical protein